MPNATPNLASRSVPKSRRKRGGGLSLAEEYDVELLGQLPLDVKIREQTDRGQPSIVADPDGPVARAWLRTARRMSARLAMQGKDYSRRFPNIVVEND